jgi:hypothetical protein
MNNFQIKLVNIDHPAYLIFILYFQLGVQLSKNERVAKIWKTPLLRRREEFL